METDDVGKLQKEIRSLKKQVERLEASRATFELMVDRNDKLLSRQLEQTQRQAEELNRINLPADSALDLASAGYWHMPTRRLRTGTYPLSAQRRYWETCQARLTVTSWNEWSRACLEKATGDRQGKRRRTSPRRSTGTIPRTIDATYAYKRPVDGRVVWIHALGTGGARMRTASRQTCTACIRTSPAYQAVETELRLAMQKVRGRHQDEEHVPREHEPRDPHADERHHRPLAPRPQDAAQSQAARLREQGPQRRHVAARHHQ